MIKAILFAECGVLILLSKALKQFHTLLIICMIKWKTYACLNFHPNRTSSIPKKLSNF